MQRSFNDLRDNEANLTDIEKEICAQFDNILRAYLANPHSRMSRLAAYLKTHHKNFNALLNANHVLYVANKINPEKQYSRIGNIQLINIKDDDDKVIYEYKPKQFRRTSAYETPNSFYQKNNSKKFTGIKSSNQTDIPIIYNPQLGESISFQTLNLDTFDLPPTKVDESSINRIPTLASSPGLGPDDIEVVKKCDEMIADYMNTKKVHHSNFTKFIKGSNWDACLKLLKKKGFKLVTRKNTDTHPDKKEIILSVDLFKGAKKIGNYGINEKSFRTKKRKAPEKGAFSGLNINKQFTENRKSTDLFYPQNLQANINSQEDIYCSLEQHTKPGASYAHIPQTSAALSGNPQTFFGEHVNIQQPYQPLNEHYTENDYYYNSATLNTNQMAMQNLAQEQYISAPLQMDFSILQNYTNNYAEEAENQYENPYEHQHAASYTSNLSNFNGPQSLGFSNNELYPHTFAQNNAYPLQTFAPVNEYNSYRVENEHDYYDVPPQTGIYLPPSIQNFSGNYDIEQTSYLNINHDQFKNQNTAASTIQHINSPFVARQYAEDLYIGTEQQSTSVNIPTHSLPGLTQPSSYIRNNLFYQSEDNSNRATPASQPFINFSQ